MKQVCREGFSFLTISTVVAREDHTNFRRYQALLFIDNSQGHLAYSTEREASQNLLRDDEALWFIAGDHEAIMRQI